MHRMLDDPEYNLLADELETQVEKMHKIVSSSGDSPQSLALLQRQVKQYRDKQSELLSHVQREADLHATWAKSSSVAGIAALNLFFAAVAIAGDFVFPEEHAVSLGLLAGIGLLLCAGLWWLGSLLKALAHESQEDLTLLAKGEPLHALNCNYTIDARAVDVDSFIRVAQAAKLVDTVTPEMQNTSKSEVEA